LKIQSTARQPGEEKDLAAAAFFVVVMSSLPFGHSGRLFAPTSYGTISYCFIPLHHHDNRRSCERGYKCSEPPVDCLYVFENKQDAVRAASASANLTLSRYTGHAETAHTMSDGSSFETLFETDVYKFHVECFKMPSSHEQRVIVNGKREMYAIDRDDKTDSFH
jgi:hypothetical protein